MNYTFTAPFECDSSILVHTWLLRYTAYLNLQSSYRLTSLLGGKFTLSVLVIVTFIAEATGRENIVDVRHVNVKKGFASLKARCTSKEYALFVGVPLAD